MYHHLSLHLCDQLEPIKEHFLTLPIAVIKTPKMEYTPSTHNLRNNLKIERQIKYLKGVLSHDYCHEITR